MRRRKKKRGDAIGPDEGVELLRFSGEGGWYLWLAIYRGRVARIFLPIINNFCLYKETSWLLSRSRPATVLKQIAVMIQLGSTCSCSGWDSRERERESTNCLLLFLGPTHMHLSLSSSLIWPVSLSRHEINSWSQLICTEKTHVWVCGLKGDWLIDCAKVYAWVF